MDTVPSRTVDAYKAPMILCAASTGSANPADSISIEILQSSAELNEQE